MFAYDKVYDILFENEEFLNVIYKFHTSNWENLNKREKLNLVEEFVMIYCKVLKIDLMKISNTKGKYSGAYLDLISVVNINENAILNNSQYDTMDTLFHELRHNFQYRAIDGKMSCYESVDQKTISLWKENLLKSPRGYSNYIEIEKNEELYFFQPTEEDAFKTGLSCTKKAYALIRDKLGEDIAFVNYARSCYSIIMDYYSDEEEYLEKRRINREKVLDIFKKNNKEFKIEEQCMIIARKTMEKEIKEMSVEEICSLFSVYVWPHLDDNYKLMLLKEYDSKTNKFAKTPMNKLFNSSFNVNGYVIHRNDIKNILNNLFSWQVKVLVEAIIADKVDFNEKLKEELKINMYVKDDIAINYIDDHDNFFLYSIQPFAIFEGMVIKDLFEKIKDVEIKCYGVNLGEYNEMIDYYDYDKYIPFIEAFYDKPFSEIYSNLIKDMKENINQLNTGRK